MNLLRGWGDLQVAARVLVIKIKKQLGFRFNSAPSYCKRQSARRPGDLNISASCWADGECKTPAVPFVGHFSGMRLQRARFRDNVFYLTEQLAAAYHKNREPPSSALLSHWLHSLHTVCLLALSPWIGWGWGSSSNHQETHNAYYTMRNKSPLPLTQESCVLYHYTWNGNRLASLLTCQ